MKTLGIIYITTKQYTQMNIYGIGANTLSHNACWRHHMEMMSPVIVQINPPPPLQWRHYDVTLIGMMGWFWRDGVSNHHVSNHQPHGCLLNRLSRCRSKKTSSGRVAGICEGNSPVTGEFPAQRVSNAENDSIWWRRHATDSVHQDKMHRRQIYIYMIP